MNLIKIAIMLRKKFAEFYDIKQYKKQASEQFIVKHYKIDSRKIIVDGSSNE
jgi:hypothetical protein